MGCSFRRSLQAMVGDQSDSWSESKSVLIPAQNGARRSWTPQTSPPSIFSSATIRSSHPVPRVRIPPRVLPIPISLRYRPLGTARSMDSTHPRGRLSNATAPYVGGFPVSDEKARMEKRLPFRRAPADTFPLDADNEPATLVKPDRRLRSRRTPLGPAPESSSPA